MRRLSAREEGLGENISPSGRTLDGVMDGVAPPRAAGGDHCLASSPGGAMGTSTMPLGDTPEARGGSSSERDMLWPSLSPSAQWFLPV